MTTNNREAKVPTSEDLLSIAKSINGYAEGLPKIIDAVIGLQPAIKAVNKIKVDELKKNMGNTSKIVKLICQFTMGLQTAFDSLANLNIDTSKFEQVRDILMSKEMMDHPDKAMSSTDEKGNKIEFLKVTKPGLLDIFNQVAGMGAVMNSMVFVNPIKFRLKFHQTLRMFEREYNALVKYTSGLNAADLPKMHNALDNLQEVMMFLPTTTAALADVFYKYGKPLKRAFIKAGIKTMVGEKGDGGLVWAIMLVGEQMNDNTLDPKQVQNFGKSVKTIHKALDTMMYTLILAALSEKLVRTGALVLFGRGKKGGLISLIITGLSWISDKTQDIKNANKNLLYLAGTVALIGITAAVIVLAAMGAVLSIPAVGIIMLFMIGLSLMFGLVGWIVDALIDDAKKGLLEIAAAVAILAFTALGIVILAQFINANWAAIGQVLAMMAGLVLAFIGIGLVTRWIDAGSKALYHIALAVGILGLVAVGLVLISNYIQGNWKGILQILVLMAALVGGVIAIGWARKQIEQGWKAMLLIFGFIAVMVIAVWVLSEIATAVDNEDLLGVTLIMFGIVVGIGGIVIAAGKLEKHLAKGMPAMLVIAEIAGIMAGVMLAIAIATSIGDPLEMLEVVGIMALIIVAVGGIALAAGALIAGPQAIVFALGLAAVGMISGLCAAIGLVGILIAGAANAIKSTGYDNAEDLAAMINLPFIAIIRGDSNGESIFGLLGELPGPIAMLKLTAKVVMLSQVASSIGNIADVLQHIASLNMPDPTKGYDKNGKPKGWKQMTANDFAAASQNASVILGMSSAMFADEPTDFVLADGSKFTTQVVNTAALDKIGFMTKYKVRRLADIVGSVGRMADVLQHISSLNMPDPDKGYDENGKPKGWKQMVTKDFINASLNAVAILKFFSAMWGDQPTRFVIGGASVTIKPLDTTALDNISRSMRRKITRLGEMVASVGGMATTLQNMSMLVVPDPDKGYDENGKPKGWLKMGTTEFANATTNVQKIATTLIEAVASPHLSQMLDDMDSDVAENFNKIMGCLGGISGITDLITMLSGGEVPTTWATDNNPDSPTYGQRIPVGYTKMADILNPTNVWKMQSNIRDMFDIVVGAVAPYNHGDKEDALHDAEDEIEDMQKVVSGSCDCVTTLMTLYKEHLSNIEPVQFRAQYSAAAEVMQHMVTMLGGEDVDVRAAKVLKENIKETNSLVQQVNKVDLNKLKTFDSTMKHISELSKSIRGDFRGLAKAINEDLLDALKKLVDVLENPPSRPAEQSTSIVAAAAPTNNKAQQMDPKKMNQAKEAQAREDIKELTKKIDKLAGVLQSAMTTSKGNTAVRVTEK